VAPDRRARARIQTEVQSGSEPHRSERTQVVLGEALIRIPNRSQKSGFQVRQSADEIDDPAADLRVPGCRWCKRVKEEGIDGEIPSAGVGRRIAESDDVGPPGVRVRAVGPECRDLDRHPIVVHKDNAERDANLGGAAEEFAHTLRWGVGGNVIVGRV
jgi:hypothetical protein